MIDELDQLRTAVCQELRLPEHKRADSHGGQFRNWNELLTALVGDWLELRGTGQPAYWEELRDRLVWCLKHRGGPLADDFSWDLCHTEMASTMAAYSESGDVESARESFVVGTCDSLLGPSNKLVAGRGTNDFRRGLYLFPATQTGRDLACEVALIRAEHGFTTGRPVLATVSVNCDSWRSLLKLDLRLPKSDLVLAGVARQFDLRGSPFSDSVAHAYNFYDVIRAPLTQWSPFGWRRSALDIYQIVCRTQLAQSLITIADVEPLNTLDRAFADAGVQRRDYADYWRELPFPNEASQSCVQDRWSACFSFRMFAHEHPIYYAAPQLLPPSVWAGLSTSARLSFIDTLTVLCGNAPFPDSNMIKAGIEKYL